MNNSPVRLEREPHACTSLFLMRIYTPVVSDADLYVHKFGPVWDRGREKRVTCKRNTARRLLAISVPHVETPAYPTLLGRGTCVEHRPIDGFIPVFA